MTKDEKKQTLLKNKIAKPMKESPWLNVKKHLKQMHGKQQSKGWLPTCLEIPFFPVFPMICFKISNCKIENITNVKNQFYTLLQNTTKKT